MSYADFRKKFGLDEEKAPAENSRSEYESFRKSQGLDTDISGIDGNFINTFLSDAQNYMKGANAAFAGMEYANRENVFASQKQKSDDLRYRSGKIRLYLSNNKSSMKDEEYNSLIAMLDYFDESAASIYNAFSKKNEGFSQFKDEDEYNTAMANWQDYYDRWGHHADADPDFGVSAAKRDYVNPSEDDLWHYDAMLDNRRWKTDYDGVTRDAYGNVVYQPGVVEDLDGNTILHPMRNDEKYVVKDPVGLFLSMDQERREGMAREDWAYESERLGPLLRKATEQHWELLSENDLNMYYYLLDTQGLDKAMEFVDYYAENRNAQWGVSELQRIQNIDGDFWKAGAYGMLAMEAGGESWATGLATALGADIKPTSGTQYASSFASQSLDGFGKYAYDATFTVGNMLPSIVISSGLGAAGVGRVVANGAGALAMGTSAGGHAYAQGLESGMTDGQAKNYGFLVGASETTLQYLLGGIGAFGGVADDVLLSKAALIDNALLRVSAKLGINIGSEIVEEELQLFLEPLFKTILTGEDYDAPTINEMVETAIVTALSTFALEGGNTIVGDVTENRQFTDTGRTIMQADGGVDALKSLANEVAGVSGVKAQKALNKKASTVSADIVTGNGVIGSAVAGFKNDSNANRVGRLYNAVQTANNKANAAANRADIAKSLQRKGFNAETANDIASVLVAEYTGQNLSFAQRRLLESAMETQVVKQVVADIIGNEQSTMGQREAKIRDFNAKVVDGVITKAAANAQPTASAQPAETPAATYAVSADGVTTDKDGNAINIDGVESTENGKLLLKTENGTIDSGDVVYASEADALVYEAVANMGATPASAWAMIKAATEDGGVSATEYATAAPLAYLYGKLGYEKGVFSNGKPRLSLTEKQSATIYQMGRSDAEASVKATSQANTNATISEKNADKEIIYEGFTYSKRKANPVQRASMEAIELINKVSSLEVHVYRSVKENGKYYAEVGGKKRIAPNGYFMDGNKIFIDINAGKDGRGVMLFTMAHEIGHYIAQNNAADFKAISDFLFEHYGEDAPIYEELHKKKQTLIESYKRDGKPVPENAQLEKEAQEELVCDMLSRMLADQHAYDKLMELKQENLNAFQKLGEAIKKFLDKIAKFIGIYDTQVTDFQMAASVETFGEEAFRQLQDLYIKAFVQADANFQEAQAQKNTTEDGGEKEQARQGGYDYSKSFAQQLEDYKQGQIPKGDTLVVGATPEVFQKIGMAALPVTLNATHVDYALYGTKDFDHHLGKALLEQLPEAIKKPVAIMTSGTKTNSSIVAMLEIRHNGKQVVMPVVVDGFGKQNGILIDSNAITSIYGKNYSISKVLHDAIVQEGNGQFRLYYLDKNKATALLQKARVPMPKNSATRNGGFIHTLADSGSPVKSRFSSVTQSQQFKRWFGDWEKHPDKASKVVNADGTPKVVYHGTSADFAIFDKRKAKEGAFGRGFYFATSNGRAKAYGSGKIMETYLSIKNPYIVHDSLGFTGEDYRNMQKQFGLQDKITDKNVGKVLQQQGYDGIMVYDGNGNVKEIVAFEPTQIKSATDNIGTFDGSNPDIRYSDRDYSYEALASKPDMVVTTVGGNVPSSRAAVAHLAKQNAAKIGKFDPKTGSVSVHVDDIDTDVILSTKGLRHGLRRTQNPLSEPNYIVTVKAGEVLKNAIRINEIIPADDNAQSSYVLMGAAKDINGTYIVRFVVNHFDHNVIAMDVLYAVNAKKELAAHNAPRLAAKPLSVTSSIISISDLLDIVNQHFPDILPEDVLKHYGYDARPDGDLGEDALYQERTEDSVSNRSLLANAFEGVAQNEVERSKIQEYRDKVALMDAEERKLTELNNQIKELSFSKGPRDTKKLRTLQLEARKIANRIGIYDKQLLRLEASKPLQDVLAREKKAAYKRAEQKGKEALEAYREKALKDQQALTAKWQESRKKGIESRNKTALRHKIRGVVNELNQHLLHGTKERHVPIELQKAVAEALDAVNMDTVGAEERIAKLEGELLTAKTTEQIQEISRKIDHIREMGDRMNGRLQKLKDAYDQFVNSDDPLISNSHDEVISNKLQAVIDSVGDTALRDMNLTQLEDVYDMYRMVLTTIRNANKAFKAKKSESITAIATEVMSEVEQAGGKKKQSLAMFNRIKEFGWNNLKPVYAFEHIGSDHFTEVFNNVRAGEDVWAVDVTEARAFYLDKAKKHNYNTWDFNKRYRFESSSGMLFELDLEQIMSLYAYSKRDQAAEHLRRGGIVFDESTKIVKKTKVGLSLEFNPTEATAYNISTETLDDIVSKLTDEQRAFVDEMQEYLSTVMGEKGNEVSLEMYGVKLFKEKHYFPLKSAQQFMAKAKEQQKGEVKIKNSGFSKETVQKASNPIVLTPFMNVWADHVNEMSMYHAFVLPMEDLYRVYHFKTATSETEATESVEMFIQNAYGKGATKYLDQLLKDLNGGARVDSTTGIINKGIGLFKKGAVFASLSVVVQQPSAIARALALVDTEYFIGPKVDHKRHTALWDEVKRYAPVAIIKEMGYFDTNMGKSTQDFITGKEYGSFREKMVALVKDSNYRDEVLSKAPSLADEIAWCGIWEAVKREQKAKNPGMDVKSEAFLKMAGERFTEVIVKTQVYDSVLSRSGMMRSKDTGMKMATAFMAEPTTSINMVADALLQGKRGNRKYARTAIGAVVASQILNTILVSFVYAGRDDDDDETYLEKYIGTFTGEVIDNLNPAGYIPFLKNIVSIVQGYEVERSDMSVISDLWKAWENLGNDNISTYRKVEGFAGSIAQIFGLPVKNIMRDARGIYQTVMSFMSGEKTTAAGVGNAVKSAVTGKDVSNGQQLYEAYLAGDAAQIERVKARFDDQNAINTALRKALRENDPRIHEAAVAWNANDLDEYMRIAKEIIAEKHFVQDDVVMAIRSEANALSPDTGSESSSKAKGLFTAEKFAEAVAQGDAAMASAIKADIIQMAKKNGKTADAAEKSFINSAKDELKEMFLTGNISEQAVIKALTTYCGSDQNDAKADVQYWAFKQNNPNVYAEDQWFDTYYDKVADSGIAIDVYMDYRNRVVSITGENKKAGRMAVINSLPITTAQKDALYFAEGWTASRLYEAPWH